MKNSAIKYSMVLAAMLLSVNSKAQISFTHNYTVTSCTPVTVTFTNTSSDSSAYYFIWDFRDGSPNDTTVGWVSAIHTYLQGGQYWVSLQAYDNSWFSVGQYNNNNYFTILPYLDVATDSACPGDAIYFRGGCVNCGGGAGYFIYFGDGNTAA